MKRLLIILSMFIIAVTGQQLSCDPGAITLCTAPIHEGMAGKSQMVFTKETFQRQCTITREALVCLENILKRCVGEQQTSVTEVIGPMRAFLDDFCSEGGNPLQEEYLKYADCMHPLDNEIITCGREKSEQFGPRPSTPEGQIEYMCNGLKATLSCGQDVVSAKCGAGAGNVLRKVTLRMMPKEPKAMCNLQDNAAVRGVQPRAFLTVLGIAATLLSCIVLRH